MMCRVFVFITFSVLCLFFFYCCFFFFFKQKTAYEMRISDWSSDVCSSDLDKATAMPRMPAKRKVKHDSNRVPQAPCSKYSNCWEFMQGPPYNAVPSLRRRTKTNWPTDRKSVV